MNEDWHLSFGDGLMIHHAFSNEPFTKDKFEHALVKTAKLVGIGADFASREFDPDTKRQSDFDELS